MLHITKLRGAARNGGSLDCCWAISYVCSLLPACCIFNPSELTSGQIHMTHMNSFISFDTPVRLSTTRRPGPISIPVYVLYPPICPMLRTGCSWASYTRYGNDEFITPARGDKCFATRHPFPSFKLIGCERLQLTKGNLVNFPTAVTHLLDSKLSPRQSVAKQRQFLGKKFMFQW